MGLWGGGPWSPRDSMHVQLGLGNESFRASDASQGRRFQDPDARAKSWQRRWGELFVGRPGGARKDDISLRYIRRRSILDGRLEAARCHQWIGERWHGCRA